MADDDQPGNDYLVISRGQWDADARPEDIQAAIDRFYAWHEDLVAQGRVKRGHRLAVEGKRISRERVLDGPFSEAKEVIGGFWIVVANSLDAAAELMGQNPCMAYGLSYEIRPIEAKPANAFEAANETPVRPFCSENL